MFLGPAHGFASLLGFVHVRRVQGHRELGGIPRKDPFIPPILQEDPRESPQPSRVPGAAPTAQQLQSQQEALDKTAEPKPGKFRRFIHNIPYFIFPEVPTSPELPGWELGAGWKEEKDGTAPWNGSGEL